jgi:HK97 family phage major capsid protein
MTELETAELEALGKETTPEALAPGQPCTLERTFIVELAGRAAAGRGLIDEKARTVTFPFASEFREVEQWFGVEILDHSPGAVVLERLIAAGPVLLDHMRNEMIGRVREAWIGEDRRTWAKVQFSRAAKANDIFNDVLDDIRVMVSCRYRVHSMRLVERGEKKPDTYLVTKWEPYEVSFVSIPADVSVGVGRELVEPGSTPAVETVGNAGRQEPMKMTSMRAAHLLEQSAEGGGGGTNVAPPPQVSVAEAQRAGAEAERARIAGIEDVAGKVSHLFDATDLARQFRDSGRSVAEFHAAITDKLGEVKSPVVTARAAGEGTAAIGMSRDEVRNYSLIRAVNAMLSGDWTKAGLERAASEAVSKMLGRDPQGMWFPHDVMAYNPYEQRALDSTAAGAVIDTALMMGSFIDLIRNNSVVAKVGATVLPGLTSDLDIPKQIGAITGGWIDNETYAGAESSQPAISSVPMSPKTYRMRVDITRKMLKQPSMAMEMLVRRELALQSGAGLDEAALVGSGLGSMPQGLLTMPLVPVVPIGATGGALAWNHVVDMETALLNHKRLGNLAYVTNSAVMGACKKTPRHATATVGGYLIDTDGKLNGYTVVESNFVPSNLTKSTGSNLSAMFYGAWSALLIGLWGGLDVELDKSSPSMAEKGGVTLRGFQDVDVKVQYTGAFSVCKDIATQ